MTNHAAGLTLRSSVTGARRIAIAGIVLGVIAFWSAIPPFNGRSFAIPFLFGILAIGAGIWAVSRGMRRVGLGGGRLRDPRARAGDPRHAVERREPRDRLQREPDRLDARLRDAAHVRRDRRHGLRAERGRERRPRGNDADGGLLGRLRGRQDRIVGGRDRLRPGRRGAASGSCTRSGRSICGPIRS